MNRKVTAALAFALFSPRVALAQEPPPAPPPLPPAAEPAPRPIAPAPALAPAPSLAVAERAPTPPPGDPAPAVAPSSEPERATNTRGCPMGRAPIRLALGVRGNVIATSGFDLFSTGDGLAQISLDATFALLDGKRTSLAVGLAWDAGRAKTTTRGFEASLMTYRLSVPIEGRLRVAPFMYAFGRVAPGAVLGLARLKDSGAPADLTGTAWLASADFSGGASFLLGPHGKQDRRAFRMWATPELGYGVTTRPGLEVSPSGRKEDEILGSDAPTRLGGLALSGFFFRISVAATF